MMVKKKGQSYGLCTKAGDLDREARNMTSGQFMGRAGTVKLDPLPGVLEERASVKLYEFGLVTDKYTIKLLSSCGTLQPTNSGVVTWNSEEGNYQRMMRPSVFRDYYLARNGVDVHNQVRQDRLCLERSWRTQNFQHRFFSFFMGIAEANAWKMSNYLHRDAGKTRAQFRRDVARGLMARAAAASPVPGRVQPREAPFPTNQCKLMRRPDHSKWDPAQQKYIVRPEYPLKLQMICKAGKAGRPGKSIPRCGRRVLTYCACNPAAGCCRECWLTVHRGLDLHSTSVARADGVNVND